MTNRTNLKLLLFGILILCISCKKEILNSDIEEFSISEKGLKNTHNKNKTPKDTDEFYYYSNSSNNKYNHSISGKDENGEPVRGVINLEREIGIGVLKKDDNNKIEIISEQANSNRIIATDINGYQYRLKLDD